MIVKILVDGGSMKPGPALSQKLGPAGININQVIQQVNDSTKDFQGLKVPVELDVNTSTKKFTVKVFSPPVAGLLKKELGLEKGSGTQKKLKVANASIEQIISVAKTKLPTMLCNDLKAAVKSVTGTCVSLGVLIENKLPADIEKDIDAGKYDKEIKSIKTETSPEKKKQLLEYFNSIKSAQEKAIKAEQAAKDAEAAKAAAEATVAPAAGTATAPAAGAATGKTPAAKTPAAAAKPAAKEKGKTK
jgi:large subunit ribosomal protein L11